jgi:hypothetical protein
LRSVAEKVAGKSRSFGLLLLNFFILRVDIIFTIVFCTTADLSESGETRSGSGVGVDIDNLAALNILEKSHSSVASIVLHHMGVVLTFTNIKGRVLENAPLAVRALGRMLQEVLAD